MNIMYAITIQVKVRRLNFLLSFMRCYGIVLMCHNSWISPINVRTNEANTLIQNKIIKQ
jgi:hypothetical protein